MKPLLPKQSQTIFFSLLVFIITFVGYVACRPDGQVDADPKWSIQLAISVIREGNLNLDEYRDYFMPRDYTIEGIAGHKYSVYPIGTPLIAVPFVFIVNLVKPNFFSGIQYVYPQAQVFIASFIVALTAVLIFLIARLFLTIGQSLLLVFIFSFCTSTWSTASRALWQHGPSMLCLTLALYLILRSKSKPWLIQFVSLPLAFSYVIRPTNALAIILITLFVFLYYRKYFVKYLLWSFLISIPFFLINYKTYGAFFPTYYQGQFTFHFPTLESLAGPLISPSRGLFIYTPIIMFSFWGFYMKIRKFNRNSAESMLDIFLAVIILAHCLLISSWPIWWGGWSVGPRMLSDMIPFMIYFMIPVIPLVTNPSKSILAVRVIFFTLLVFSFLIQFRGATSPAMFDWNRIPTGLDQDLSRIWDWNDPPFLRGIISLQK